MNTEKKHKVIGLMSGTSLDGVDIAACEFWMQDTKWAYRIVKGKTVKYHPDILNRLKEAQHLNGLDLAQLNADYGIYLGKLVKDFVEETGFEADFMASHGYTVFHEPHKSLTLQIGSGAHIAAHANLKTICDFRTTDVALGGQGAPLVPIGDELLFAEYLACLNLGGFSNISYKDASGTRIAFDICAVNFVLNHLAQHLGKEFDDGGTIGKSGQVNVNLLSKLNALEYYHQKPPKSLGREFVEQNIFPLFTNEIAVEDLLATFYEHVAMQLSTVLNELGSGKVLVTGGGANNMHLIELLSNKTNLEIVVSEKDLIEYKEALIFAFLGVLRELEYSNCLSSVTGATENNCGGCIYLS